jgi:stage II sporulation protein M
VGDWGLWLLRHRMLHRYLPYLLISLATFALGVVFGLMAYGVLTPTELQGLRQAVNEWVARLRTAGPEPGWFTPALTTNLKSLGLLYLLGLSVVGLPLVLAALFLRGFVIGFSLGVLWNDRTQPIMGWVLGSVALQNVLWVPALVVTGALALSFSWWLIRGRGTFGEPGLGAEFGQYTVGSALMAAVAVAATAWEVLGAPALLRWVAG